MNHLCTVVLLALVSSAAAAAPPPGCELRDSGRYVCKAKLTVNAAGQLIINPDQILVPRPELGTRVVVVWRLTNDNYHFDAVAKDGIRLKKPNAQFTDPCASNDDGECFPVPKPNKFRWKVANTAAFDELYCITLYDNSGVPHFYDPTIRNSFSLLDSWTSGGPPSMTASAPINPVKSCPK